jgi:hypothetical protein
VRRLKARGQAVLELSLLLIVMVPIIFYSLFLDDLLRYRLDLLESVVSSPWDFAAIDQQENNGGNVAQFERHAWCDHTYTYNSYDIDYECDSSPTNANGGAGRHHKAFTAHVCWLVEGGQQIECSTDDSTGKIDDNAKYNGGGVTTCSARAGVFNYFIVQQAMVGFTNMTNLTKAEHMSGAVHGHFGAASANIFMLEKQQFALLHDDWATKTPDDVDAMFDFLPDFSDLLGQGKTFKGRVKIYYDKFAKFDEADDFFDKIKDDKLIDEGADDDGLGDDPSTLHMSFNKDPGHGFGIITKHTSSAWSDQRVQDTEGARVDEYFGVPQSTW